MKKFLLSLSLFLIFPYLVLAKDKIEFSLNDVNISNEKEIEINLNIKNNPGFGYLGLQVEFNQEKLEYVSSEIVGMKNALMKGADINKDGNLSVYALQVSDKKLIDDNGTILKIKLKVKKDFYTTDVNLTNVSIGKDENQTYEFNIDNSKVKMKLEEKSAESDTKNLEKEVSEYIKDENIDYKDIEWSSSNENVGKIDQNGNIKFNKSGKTTITGKVDDKVVFEKTYEIKNNNFIYFIIFIPIVIVLIIIAICLIIRKRKKLNSK